MNLYNRVHGYKGSGQGHLVTCPSKSTRNRLIAHLHDLAKKAGIKRFRTQKISPTRFYTSHAVDLAKKAGIKRFRTQKISPTRFYTSHAVKPS